MIKIKTREYREGDLAIKIVKVTFLGILILERKESTTNNNIVDALTTREHPNKINGFYGIKNKN